MSNPWNADAATAGSCEPMRSPLVWEAIYALAQIAVIVAVGLGYFATL